MGTSDALGSSVRLARVGIASEIRPPVIIATRAGPLLMLACRMLVRIARASIPACTIATDLSLVLVVVEIGSLLLLLPVPGILVGSLEIHLAIVVAVVLVAAQVAVEVPGARVYGLLAVLVADRDLGD